MPAMNRFEPAPKTSLSIQLFSVFLTASCIVDFAIVYEFSSESDGLILLLEAKYVVTAILLLGIRLVSVGIRRAINKNYPAKRDDP